MKIIFLALAAAVLAACGQGTGTGTTGGADSKVSANEQDSLSRTKSLQVTKNSGSTVSFNASTLLIDALTHDAIADEGGVNAAGLQFMRQLAYVSQEEPSRPDGEYLQKIVDYQKTQTELKNSGSIGMQNVRAAAAAGDSARVADALEQMAFRNVIVGCMQPNIAWPVDPMPRSEKLKQQAARYIAGTQRDVMFTNLVLTEVAAAMTAPTWRDPAAARQAALILFYDMPPQKLRDAWAASKDAATTAGVVIDLKQSSSIHWSGPVGDFVGDGSGWTVLKNGGGFFNNGFLSGRQVSIVLASAISASTQQQSASQSSSGVGSGVGVQSGANVK